MYYIRKKSIQVKNYILRYWKHLLLTGIVFLLIIFIMGIFEFFLDSDNTERWDPILKNEDILILRRHISNSKNHPFGFNDYPYPEKKEKPCFRLIVLGDSVVFGDGLPLEQIWSRKLEKNLKRKYPVEVLHWGQCGWSTLDQLDFLKHNFSDKKNIFDADLILISLIINDPDMGNIRDNPQKLLSNPLFNIFNRIFPKLGSKFYELDKSRKWNKIMKQLYSDKNLFLYQKVLQDLKLFCLQKKTDLFIVILSSGSIEKKNEPEQIENLLQKEDIPHFNLHPFVAEQVENVSRQKIYASPVNLHPGPILTTLYARYTLPELIKRYGNHFKERSEKI